MELKRIRELTREYGGFWGIAHVDRLLRLGEILGEGLEYDSRLIWIAAHLHDWGAYSPYVQEGKDHAIRSREVAQDLLTQLDLDEAAQRTVLSIISEQNSRAECHLST